MRMIDADYILSALGVFRSEEPESTNFMYGIRTAREIVEDAPTIGSWISVQDRLPEKSGWYLVSLVNTRTGHRWKVPASADYSYGKWDYAYLGEEDATWTQNNTVTHWMPLPEPPKEEQE